MNARDYESALRHLYRCDALCRTLDRDGPSGFMVMANMKMGNVYDLTSQRELAVKEYNKVLGMKEYQNSYALAQQFLRTPYAQ